MTRFTVTWHRDAEGDLALSTDAATKGEAVSEDLRAFNSPPLRVLFVARESDRVVQVELVRRI